MSIILAHVRLSAVIAIASAASMALEIAASRMIAPYVGMSLYTWTAVIAVVLGGLAIGHWFGGVLADRERVRDRALFVILIAGCVTAFATQFALRAFAGGVLDALNPISGVVALTTLVFFLPSFFAGAVGPLATFIALERTDQNERGRVLGQMYALGAAGAIAGVLGSGLLLIPTIGSTYTVVTVAMAYALAAILAEQGKSRILAGGCALLMLIATAAFGDEWSPCDRESGYFCIRVDDISPTARVLALDHLAHSVNERDNPLVLHSPYLALINEIAVRRFGEDGPTSAFFVGGGAYTLPRAWAERWPSSDLIVSEIDPVVSDVAQKRLWVDLDAFDVRHSDARMVLARENGVFDAIIGDAFADISIPPHLVSDEFHQQIKAHLSENGFYAMNVVDLLRRPRFLVSLAETLKRRFAVVEMWVDRNAISEVESRTTWIIVASDTASPSSSIVSTDGSGRAWHRVSYERMINVFAPSDRVFLTDDHAPVARLLGPLLLDRRFSE